jgi:hypothetical protein
MVEDLMTTIARLEFAGRNHAKLQRGVATQFALREELAGIVVGMPEIQH